MVVSNSSPLIFYARIGRLDLLRELFATVHIPMAVRDEISFGGGNRSGAAQVAAMPWILLHPVANRESVGVLRARLGPGEAEAMKCSPRPANERLHGVEQAPGRQLLALPHEEPAAGELGGRSPCRREMRRPALPPPTIAGDHDGDDARGDDHPSRSARRRRRQLAGPLAGSLFPGAPAAVARLARGTPLPGRPRSGAARPVPAVPGRG